MRYCYFSFYYVFFSHIKHLRKIIHLNNLSFSQLIYSCFLFFYHFIHYSVRLIQKTNFYVFSFYKLFIDFIVNYLGPKTVIFHIKYFHCSYFLISCFGYVKIAHWESETHQFSKTHLDFMRLSISYSTIRRRLSFFYHSCQLSICYIF